VIPLSHSNTSNVQLVICHFDESIDWLNPLLKNLPMISVSIVQKLQDSPAAPRPIVPHRTHPTVTKKEKNIFQLIENLRHSHLTHLNVSDQPNRKLVHYHIIATQILNALHVQSQQDDPPYLRHLSEHYENRISVNYISNEIGMGRECVGYLSWILANYNHLPEWMVFTHGHRPYEGIEGFLRNTLKVQKKKTISVFTFSFFLTKLSGSKELSFLQTIFGECCSQVL
jgi:hypothetical protein